MVTFVEQRALAASLGASDYVYEAGTLGQVQARHGTGTGRRKTKALIIDDDADTRARIRKVLERDGWSVTEAENGQEGLDKLASAKPGIILLDLTMPVMDGFHVPGDVALQARMRRHSRRGADRPRPHLDRPAAAPRRKPDPAQGRRQHASPGRAPPKARHDDDRDRCSSRLVQALTVSRPSADGQNEPQSSRTALRPSPTLMRFYARLESGVPLCAECTSPPVEPGQLDGRRAKLIIHRPARPLGRGVLHIASLRFSEDGGARHENTHHRTH